MASRIPFHLIEYIFDFANADAALKLVSTCSTLWQDRKQLSVKHMLRYYKGYPSLRSLEADISILRSAMKKLPTSQHFRLCNQFYLNNPEAPPFVGIYDQIIITDPITQLPAYASQVIKKCQTKEYLESDLIGAYDRNNLASLTLLWGISSSLADYDLASLCYVYSHVIPLIYGHKFLWPRLSKNTDDRQIMAAKLIIDKFISDREENDYDHDKWIELCCCIRCIVKINPRVAMQIWYYFRRQCYDIT